MARIEMVTEPPASPAVAEAFAWVRAQGGEVPNLYRVLGAAPDMLKAWIDFAWALRREPGTPRALRELVILRVAQATGASAGAAYEWAQHVVMAEAAGVPAAQIEALSAWRASDAFDAGERAALAMAEEVARGPGASAETMAALTDAFAPEAAVELTLTASFYVCVARFLTSMAVDLEPEFSAEGFRPDPA